MTVKKGTVGGVGVGMLLSISTFSTSAIIAPFLLAAAFCQLKLQKLNLLLFLLLFFITFWIIVKSWSIDAIGAHLLSDTFLVFVVTVFSVLKINNFILKGITIVFVLIALLDASSNFMQLTFGADFLGNTPISGRSDGVRLVGITGHTFISLGIYLCAFLLLRAAGIRRMLAYAPIFLMLVVGSFRAYIFPLILPTYHVLFRMRWPFVFFASLAISGAVAIATVYSVAYGLQSETSGNAFRVFAWQQAIEEISRHPLFGINVPPPPLPEELAITEDNLVYYQIYESMMLQDAVRYGLPLVFLKIIFFFLLGKMNYQKQPFRAHPLAETKNFLVAFLVVDYVVFSYFTFPVTALVAGIILGTNESKNK